MSQHTVERLPQSIRHVLKVYKRASSIRVSPYKNDYVRSFLEKSDPQYNALRRYRLLNRNEKTDENEVVRYASGAEAPWYQFNPADFTGLEAKLIKPIFEPGDNRKSIVDLGPVENMSIDEIFNNDVKSSDLETVERAPLVGDAHIAAKPSSEYEARILTILASHYRPYLQLPKVEHLARSFQWYHNLLTQTPIVIFVRQRHRLISDSSLARINKPYHDLSTAIRKLSLRFTTPHNYESGSDKLKRNYHVTDLNSVDIFSLAIKSQNMVESLQQHHQQADQLDWASINQVEDKLASMLTNQQSVQLTNASGTPIANPPTFEELKTNFPVGRIGQILKDDFAQLEYAFPFNLTYSSLYMITIESPVVDENHAALLDTLQQHADDFDIVGVRLSLRNDSVRHCFTTGSSLDQASPHKPSSDTYEQLLERAKSNAPSHISTDNISTDNTKPPSSHITSFLKHLGESGLAQVEEGCHKNCIYLFPSVPNALPL